MQIHRSLENVRLSASACALGMFDGIHVGHVMVLENALRESRIRGIPNVVVTFANHPQSLISQTPTELLSSLEERLERFDQMGFDYALILEFNAWLKNLPASEFIQRILLDGLGVQSATVGYDHRFGKNRAGDGAFLKQAGADHGFDVHIIDPVRLLTESAPDSLQALSAPSDALPLAGQIISSTLIRKLLAFGDVREANQLLGRPYQLGGIVENGLQRGRELGFPTANIAIETERLIPGNGVYGGTAFLDTVRYPAVCNIGLSPTFGDQIRKRVEVHLLDYQGSSFYGETLTMTFLSKIRDERKFTDVKALIAQIRQDCQAVTEQQPSLL